MLSSLINLGLLLLAALSIYGYGAAILRVSRVQLWTCAARLAYALAFGLGALVLTLFGLGLVDGLRPLAGWALLVMGLALLPLSRPLTREVLRGVRARLADLRGWGWGAWAVAALFILQFGLHLLADLAPPVEGDTVNSYLLTPRYWVTAGRYWQPSHIWASTLPGHLMMLSAWGLLLRGVGPAGYSLATLLTGSLMSLFVPLGVYGLARTRFNARAGFLAAGLVFLMPDHSYLAESAKVDLGWAFFEVLALAALLRWTIEDEPQRRWLVLGGACSGLALGAKSQAVMSVLFLGGWIFVVGLRREGLGRTLRALVVFSVVAVSIGAPYLVYNAVAHHNPTYPVLAGSFARWLGGTPSPRSELGTEIFYEWTPLGYLRNLWDASLGHPPPFYLGLWAGPAFLMLIPLGFVLGKRERVTDGLVAYAFLYSVAWFLTKQAVRHFLPGLALLAVVAGYVLDRLGEEPRWLRHAIYAALTPALALGVAFWGGIIVSNGAHRAALGVLRPEAYVARWVDDVVTVPTFPDSEILNYARTELDGDARILTLHTPLTLYFSQDMVSASWGDRVNVGELDTEKELLDYLGHNGIDYLLIFKADLVALEGGRDLPLFSQPGFYEEHAELEVETARTALYRLTLE